MTIDVERIPKVLRDRPQWVLWRMDTREGMPTKVPYSRNGVPAKANDASTWSPFADIIEKYGRGGWNGIGYEFSNDDSFCGIDLDGCRDSESGRVAEWAREIVLSAKSYAEVSPSGTGVKLFVIGQWKADGHKRPVSDVEVVCDKQPGIEVYDRVRYFAVTGTRLAGTCEIIEAQPVLDAIAEKYFSPKQLTRYEDFYTEDRIVERARKYLARVPPAISGQSGHDATYRAACVLVLGFGLPEETAFKLLTEWNATCVPPWSEHDLRRKVSEANKNPGDRNYLRDVPHQRFDRIAIPSYQQPKRTKPEPRETTLQDAAEKYLEAVRTGGDKLTKTGLVELDNAIGGGLALHEMALLCGRPGHGKSLVGLQFIQNWTGDGIPCAMISEEMSAYALGKRAVQYASGIPVERWHSSLDAVEQSVAEHFSCRSKCVVVEGCSTAEVAAERIRLAVKDSGVQCVVVDYAQLLSAPGKERKDQAAASCQILRQVANEEPIVLILLCQLNREIEKRKKFIPLASDIKETGQYEQDADVIVFGCWPHRLDHRNDPKKYQFFVLKNRNRAINAAMVDCAFDPARQMVVRPRIEDHPNYNEDLGEFDDTTYFPFDISK